MFENVTSVAACFRAGNLRERRCPRMTCWTSCYQNRSAAGRPTCRPAGCPCLKAQAPRNGPGPGHPATGFCLLDEIAGGLTEAECQSLDRDDPGQSMPPARSIVWIEHVTHALLAVVSQADRHRLRQDHCRRRSAGGAVMDIGSGASRFTWGWKSDGDSPREGHDHAKQLS